MLSSKKSRFQKLFDLLIKPILKTGITPNQLTGISVILALAFFCLFVTGNYIASLLSLVLSIAIDALDGHLARARKIASVYGAYLDTIVDRYVEFIIYFALLFVALPAIFFDAKIWIALCIFGSMMTTYSKAAFSEKTGKSFSGGLLERAERMILLIMGVIFYGIDKTYLIYILVILAILTNVSALERVIRALKLCTKN